MENLVRKFHKDALEYVTLMLIAAFVITIVFLLIDPWFAVCCFMVGLVLALLMWAASIILDVQDNQRHPKPPKETP